MVIVPRMGGVAGLSAWTGGKPRHDWSSLAPEAPTDYATPNQLRPTTASSSQKGYNFRRTGLKEKFAKTDDRSAFEKLVWKHLVDTGMDTVAYLPSVADPTNMVNVVQYYSQFTTKTARDQYNILKPNFDRYDLNNDQAALDFLLDSVESNLREVISEKLKDDDGFVVAWLQLVKSIKVTNLEHYEKLKQAIKARLPSQYSGENVLELART